MIKPDLKGVSSHPGVYLMHDVQGEILYVGKAKNLKKRVASYFRNSASQRVSWERGGISSKTRLLVEKVVRVESIVVKTEVEALVLENELIKKHRPPFNVLLRDDKNYLYIRITMQDEFPRILLARKIVNDGAKYFGPYTESKTVYTSLKLIKKIFPICSSNAQITSEKISKGSLRACLSYHLGICPGVCLGKVSSADYKATMKEVTAFIGGHYDLVIKELKIQMQDASVKKKFELAAKLRDNIEAVEKLSVRQVVVSSDIKLSADAIGIARQLNKVVVSLLSVRGGKLLGNQIFVMESKYESSDVEVAAGFVRDYYNQVDELPKYIYLPVEMDETKVLTEWLTVRAKHKVEVICPKQGDKRQLVTTATQNAQLRLGDLALRLGLEQRGGVEGVEQLKQILRLDKLDRIEAYDISNTQGTDSVGSMVVWENGAMNKSQYRRFKIKTVVGPNDFASLAEVLVRRFKHIESASQQVSGVVFARRPDLILIDGGKGQVNTVADALGPIEIKIIGMSKSDHSASKAKDDIVLPHVSQPIILVNNSPAKYLLQNIRDEAHRFALGLHTHLARKRMSESQLEKVPGIGSATRSKLIKKFGSMTAVKSASLDQIVAVVGISKAMMIKDGLN